MQYVKKYDTAVKTSELNTAGLNNIAEILKHNMSTRSKSTDELITA